MSNDTSKPTGKTLYELFAYKSVTIAGKLILKGETIEEDTYKKLCSRVKPYFRKK